MITKAYMIDLAERGVWTFGQSFVAVFFAVGVPTNGADLKTLSWSSAAAGGAAVLSLVKSVIAGARTGTASTSKVVAATAVVQSGGEPPVTVEVPASETAPPPIFDYLDKTESP